MTDQEILSAISQGNLSEFSTLYDRYAPRGLRFAYSMTGDIVEAEEVLQEAFCRLLGPLRRGQFSGANSSFGPFFFQTIRHLSIDKWRTKNRRRVVPMDDVPEPIQRLEGLETEKLETRIADLMDELPDQWADALRLKVDGGLSYEEIAETLNCTRAQVRTWIYRARRKLEQQLRDSGLAQGVQR